MKVKIKAYHAVAEWKWDLPDNADSVCGICRVEYEGTCAKCKYPGDDCPIMVGECTHCFHMHCISDWLESPASQSRCPLCRQVFKEKVAGSSAPVANNPQTPGSNAGRSPG